MKTLPKYHACNHCVTGENTFKNILIGPGKLPGLSRNGPQLPVSLIAQLVEHCTGIVEVMGSIPVQA